MPNIHLIRQSLESISHQPNPRFWRELVEAFVYLREHDQRLTGGKNDRSVIKNSRIEAIVKKYTGLSINFECSNKNGITAYTIPPQLDRNHALYGDLNRPGIDNTQVKARLKKNKGAIDGYIDLDVGKVFGDYTKIDVMIFVASQIVQDEMFTPEEATAIFLHEVGHTMTYFEYLGRSISLTHVLGDLVTSYNNAETRKQRVKILEVTSGALNLQSMDVQTASEIVDGELINHLVVSEVANTPVSGVNTRLYDYRTWEALSDQYVNRMGGGRHLATGLDRLMRLMGSTTYYSNKRFLVLEAFTVLLTGATAFFYPGFFLLAAIVFTIARPMDLYDPPRQRMNRIRQDLIQAMKNPKINREFRRRLQEDVDVLANLLKDIKDRESVIGFVWRRLYSDDRKQMNRIKVIQELETMANNELFVKANQLTAIADGETTNA